jgi:hypothetical protein
MSTDELKISLISRITSLNDDSLLEDIQRLLEFEANEGVYKLSDIQRREVNEAKTDFIKGNYLSSDGADEEVKKWLDE